jgi:murein DD-endopeptidase MepM/ murein hydrolase activator NlpD
MLSVGTRDFFDIKGSWDTFREVKLAYGRFGFGERVDLFESDEPHGFTRPRREAAMRWLRRWLLKADDAPVEPDFPIATDAQLQCTESGQVLTAFKDRSVFDLNAERAVELERTRAQFQASHDKAGTLARVRELIGLSGPVKPAQRTERGKVAGVGCTITKLVFETGSGVMVPAWLFRPDQVAAGTPLIVATGYEPEESLLERGEFHEQLARLGLRDHAVLLADLRGMGTTAPQGKSPFGADWKEAFLALHLNRPLLGQRVGDLLAVIAALPEESSAGIRLIAAGTTGPIALHAAALEPRITGLATYHMTTSWADVARAVGTRDQLANVVPGALAYYDLPDLARLIAPRPLTLSALVDPVGLPVPQERLESTYAACKPAYSQAAAGALKLEAGPPRPARTPLLRTVDLAVGETQSVVLSNGKPVTVKLVAVDERRDPIREAVREAKVTVEVDGRSLVLSSGNYNLPRTIAGVQVDAPITGGYRSNSGDDPWGLVKDARIRLWPAGSPWIDPTAFLYPARQRWFASSTQMANEPTYVDGGEEPKVRKIYYHNGLDIGGAEGLVAVVAATDGVVVSSGTSVLTGFRDTPVRPRYDVVYLLDDQGWYYRYSHMQTIDPAITPGATVRMGQKVGVLGKEGGSGGWSHLHFDITSRQPSGRWGTQEGYAFLWQANQRENKPEIIAVARPHRFTWAGEPVPLDASKSWSRAGAITRFEWIFSDGSTASGPTASRSYDRPGAYSEIVKVTDRQGHVAYDFAIVQVLDRSTPDQIPPTIHAAYAPTSGIRPGDPVTFKVRTFRSTDGQETWDFGDGSAPVDVQSDGNVNQHARDGYAVTTHRYEKPGQYLVRVQRTDRRGATATARLVVEVAESGGR